MMDCLVSTIHQRIGLWASLLGLAPEGLWLHFFLPRRVVRTLPLFRPIKAVKQLLVREEVGLAKGPIWVVHSSIIQERI